MKKRVSITAFFFFACISGLFAQAEDMQQTVAFIKKNLADSKEKIKQYEWLESTTVFYKGEEKSVKQNQCYYSVNGKLTKVATGATTEAKTPGGLRGRAAANKKEDMTEYITAAVEKIENYLPPDPAKIQQIFGAGKMNVQVLEPGKKFKLSFPDYIEPGDLLSLTVDKANQKIMAIDVSTSVDKPDEKVLFNITYNNLPDGTQYAGNTTLDAKAKEVKIIIVNSGFKKAAGK